jgi:hypothetical protein
MPDYMVDPYFSRNAGPPDMAAQLFGMISSLPDQYQAGAKQKFERGQMARTEELQKPVLGPNGEPITDYSTLLREYMKRSGPTPELLSLVQGQEANEMIGRALGGGDQPSGGSPYSPSNPNMTPDAHTGRAGQRSEAPPQGPAGENPAHQNIRQLAVNAGIDTNSPEFKQAFRGTDIDREFVPGEKGALQRKGAAMRIEMLAQGDMGPGQTAALGPPGMPQPAAQARAAGQPPPVQMAQAGPAPSGLETPVGNENQARFYEERGRRAMAVSAARGAAPAAAAAAQKAAEADFARAKDIRDKMAEYGKTLDPRFQREKTRQEVMQADIKSGEKKYDGLQSLGQAGTIGNQKLDRIRAIMSDPNFFSGAGHEIAQKWNQWTVSLGGNPSKAQPMEEFHKTAQQLLTDDIKAMGASGAGPVRVAEVQIMKQATANLGISPAANRYLVEEAYRVHNDNVQVARLAQQYRQRHDYLDAGWDAVRDKFYQEYPLFTKEELADPRLVSPPYLPKDIAADPARHEAWIRQQGIKPGDPIKTDDPRRPIVYAR